MGYHATSKMVKELAKRLCKDPNNFAAKSMRRSAAIQLTKRGTSLAVFQMAGNWKGVITSMKKQV